MADDLEHIVVMSDFQDFGGIPQNLNVMNQVVNWVSTKFNPKDTDVVTLGDTLDDHVTHYTKGGDGYVYENDALAQANQKLMPSQEEINARIEEFIKDPKREEALKNMPEEQRRMILNNIALMPMYQKYAAAHNQIWSQLKKKGFRTRGVIGNNDTYLFGHNIDETRKILSPSGLEFIDTGKTTTVRGVKVFSSPYWAIPDGQGGEHLEESFDNKDISKSPVYKQLQKEGKGINAIMIHGKPVKGSGLDKYISEYTGETLWVFHGHQGSPGVTYATNDNGAEIIYVCSNNRGPEAKGTVFDVQASGGKIQKVVQYEYGYGKAKK